MALKVSQTKFYWASSKKTWEVMVSVLKKNTICLPLEMLGIHFEHYKTLISSFLWILFSTIAKNDVWSSNHMHLFTSKSLSNYDKPQIKGVQEGEGGKGHGQNFLQGKYHYLMSSQTFENECPLFCKCSLLTLKESGTKCNNKSILCVFFKDTCPNVTVGVRNDSPQRLRSLLQPKGFPANHLEPILGLSIFFWDIYRFFFMRDDE